MATLVRSRSGVTVQGDTELLRTFEGLTGSLQRQVIRPAVQAGATVLAKEIRRRAPVGPTRNLKRSVSSRAWTLPAKGIIGRVVGPAYPRGAHGHLVEFGHAMVTHAGATVGQVRPRPFMRPAMDASRGRVLVAIQQKARQRIPLVAERAARRALGRAVR